MISLFSFTFFYLIFQMQTKNSSESPANDGQSPLFVLWVADPDMMSAMKCFYKIQKQPKCSCLAAAVEV